MVKHIILWQLREELSAEEALEVKKGMKEGLENLKEVLPGIVEIHVQTDCLASSNADVLLDSTFENEEALKNYAVSKEHVAVADEKVKPFTRTRVCMDYEIADGDI